MAEQFQTSFIPKKTFDVGTPAPKKASSIQGLLSFIAIVFFILSLVGAGGVFLYGRFLISSIDSKKASLEKAKNAFEPELIRELSQLDAKLRTAQKLLNAHIAPSGLFDLLEEVTLSTVRFNSFSFVTTEEGLRVSMQGEATSFSSVALQSDEFAKNRSIREPVFSGLTLDARGNVQFSVSALIDPALLSYKDRATRGGSAFFDIDSAQTGDVAGVATTSEQSEETTI